MEPSSPAASLSDTEIFIRLGLASAGGLILGFDRQIRGFAAGMRTHAMVSLSSAGITVSAFILYAAGRAEGDHIDPLRGVQGLAQAIGFIAAGAIFVQRGDVHNLTSAANVWLAAAVGIAAGAGQFVLGAMAVGFGVLIVTVIRFVERFLPGSDKARNE